MAPFELDRGNQARWRRDGNIEKEGRSGVFWTPYTFWLLRFFICLLHLCRFFIPEGEGGRPQRQRLHVRYDETKRRGPRRAAASSAYMERGSGSRRSGAKRHAIVIGAVTVARVVRGRYEWRDGGLTATQQ